MFNHKTLTDLDIELLKQKYPHNYKKKIEQVKKNYPIQYLIGNVDFLNTNILVNKNVLIPRFETEYLVEKIINKLRNIENLNVLDIGTGSGCIAIALKKNLNINMSALDISSKALKVAKKNAKLNNVKIKFFLKNILTTKKLNQYDVYISNPPYISSKEIVDEAVKYEPQKALYAKEDGLEYYKKIINIIENKPRLIAFEIGETQAQKIIEIAKMKFKEANISVEKDLCGKNRYIFIEHC